MRRGQTITSHQEFLNCKSTCNETSLKGDGSPEFIYLLFLNSQVGQASPDLIHLVQVGFYKIIPLVFENPAQFTMGENKIKSLFPL